MAFGLKNVGATYHRAMNAIFHDMLGHHMEGYIDDIVVKTKRASEHVDHLRKSFERIRLHQLKLNPLNCAFRVRQRGIEVDQNKAKAISSTNAPQSKKTPKKYLRRFISNLTGKTKEFSNLVKLKDMEEFKWEERHQAAFDKIKEYLSKPPILMPPIQGHPLKLYLSATMSQ